MTGARLVWAVRAKAVELPRFGIRKIAVPDFVGAFGQVEPREFPAARWIEQAKLDARRIGGKYREVHTQAVPGRAKRIRTPGKQPVIEQVSGKKLIHVSTPCVRVIDRFVGGSSVS